MASSAVESTATTTAVESTAATTAVESTATSASSVEATATSASAVEATATLEASASAEAAAGVAEVTGVAVKGSGTAVAGSSLGSGEAASIAKVLIASGDHALALVSEAAAIGEAAIVAEVAAVAEVLVSRAGVALWPVLSAEAAAVHGLATGVVEVAEAAAVGDFGDVASASVSVACALRVVVAAVVVVGAAVAVKVASAMDPAGAAGASIEVSGIGAVIDVAATPAGMEVVVAAVVPEVSAAPVSAVEAYAEVAEAIVDAAVVADGGTPVAGVPEVAAGSIAPVTGSPEGAYIGREDPGPVHPFISLAGPSPVARSPDVAIAGHDRLCVDGDWGRGDCNRDEDACVRRGWGQKGRASEDSSPQDGGSEDVAELAGEVHCLPSPEILRFARTGWASRITG